MENSAFPIVAARCEHLRWKGMFVDPSNDTPDEESVLWCFCTQLGQGPDGKPVDRAECSPARTCYAPL